MIGGRVFCAAQSALLCAAVCGCGGQTPRAPVAVRPSINKAALARKVDLDFRGVPLDRALARVASEQGLRIQVSRQAAKRWKGVAPEVYFRVHEMPLGTALRVLLDLNGLALADRGNRLDVVPKGSIRKPMLTQEYPLLDLIGR